MNPPGSPPPAVPKRRRWRLLGWPGCLGLALVGLGLALALLPVLVAPWARGWVEDAFAERFQGRIALGRLELGWLGTGQLDEARLLDPEGHEVARVAASLPGLLALLQSGGRDLGRLRVEIRAALVADEQGVSNLERALAPRRAAAPSDPSEEPAADADPLAGLNLDLELVAPSISWSDARTRAAGQPFEVRDLELKLALHPGQPRTLRAEAVLAGESPGAITLQAELDGLRPTQASGSVRGFSSAMLDGLARQRGRLEALLGPTFDVSFDVAPKSQAFALALDAERAHLGVQGRLEQAPAHAAATGQLALVLGRPQPFAAGLLAPLLPAGQELVWSEDARPWKLDVREFSLPWTGALPAGREAWITFLQALDLDLRLEIPGGVGLENEATLQAGLQPRLTESLLTLTCGRGKPLLAGFDARLVAGQSGAVRLRASASDPWSALAEGRIPAAEVEFALDDLSNAALEALLGRPALLTQTVGRSLDLKLALHGASLDRGTLALSLRSANLDVGIEGSFEAGTFTSTGEQRGHVRCAPPPQWMARELAPLLPEGWALELGPQPLALELQQLSLPFPAASLDELLRGAQASLELQLPTCTLQAGPGRALALGASHVQASLARGGPLAFRLDTALGAERPARSWCQGELPALVELLQGKRTLSAELACDQLDARWLDPWLAAGGRLASLAGETLDLRLRTRSLEARSGELDLLVQSAKLELRASLRGQDGRWSLRDPEASRVVWKLERSDLERELAPSLPAGTTVALDPAESELVLALRRASCDTNRPFELATWLAESGLEAELRLPGLGFANEWTRAAAIEPELRSCVLRVGAAASGGFEVRLASELGGLGQATLRAEARGRTLADLEAEVELQHLPCSLIDALAGSPGLASELLGAEFALSLALKQQTLDVRLDAPRGRLAARGAWVERTLALDEAQGLALELQPTNAWLEQRLAGKLPAASRLALAADAAPLALRVSRLQLALPAEGEAWNVWLARSSCQLEARLPDLVWSEAAPGGAPVELALRSPVLRASLAPSAAPALDFACATSGEPAGRLALRLQALDPLEMLAREDGPARFRVALDLDAQGLPVGLADALAGQEGLLLELLGPRADLRLESDSLSLESGALLADFSSPQGQLHLDGMLEQGTLRVAKPKGLSASFGLGPLASRRVVGRMLPLVCQLEKPAGSAPARLEVDLLSFPLDGDLARVDGTLRLDLGEVSYALLPGLGALFGSAAERKSVRIPALAIPIEKGVVRYQRLVLPIGGREFAFRGSFALADGRIELATEIPLELLGRKVNAELEKARELLDPRTAVPIEIRGTWDKPSFSVGRGFLESVVKQALGSALEKGLEDLLKKKKPKKD